MVLALLLFSRGTRPAMLTPACTIALAVACLALQGCLLFTTPVNQPPRIEILPPTGSASRGQPIKVVAEATDPDGSPPRVEWSTSIGRCTAGPRPATEFQSPTGMPTFTFTPAGDSDITCVWALATDAQGATDLATREVSSQNTAPVAVIKVLAPTTQTNGGRYELYSFFRLSGLGSTDPDGDKPKDPQWRLEAPQSAKPTPELRPCPGAMPNAFLQCLDVSGFSGDYKIVLTVSDGPLRSPPATLTLVVDDDHPACVKTAEPPTATSPIVLDPAEAKTFSITEILDDGTPFPTPTDGAHGTPTFVWKVRRNAGAWQSIVGYDNIAALTLPAGSYVTGDKVDVDVTISDGVPTHLQPACDARCPAGCPQSAGWAVEYR